MRATSLLVFLCCYSLVAADERQLARAEQFENTVAPLLRMYCADCHSGEDPEAGLLLEFSDVPDLTEHYEEWTVILQKVGGQEMPPEDSVQPSDDERKRLVTWISEGLADFDCTKEPFRAHATVRRLNRFEYNNVIRDLFHIDVAPADDFPADDVGEGFDNIGEVLSLPPLLMEKYLEAAESVTETMFQEKSVWQQTFPKSAANNEPDRAAVRDDVTRLARKALRRPVSQERVDRLMQLHDLAGEKTDVLTARLAYVTQAILISPEFLFRLEEGLGDLPPEPTLLGDHEIASRLSFFLWSTLPDDELSAAAAAGGLNTPESLASHTRRMLRDPKMRAFVDSFAGQWLELRLLDSMAPDPDLFPTFSNALRENMAEETKRFFHELIAKDGRILDLIDSDYTFLNERLAKHYGIGEIQGEHFRRVTLEDDRRGGILSHASILTLTSNPTRTSPVKRGKWILENILGTPPPPPPPNVPELEEGDELLGSLRERMQQHRENPSCAVCHRKMDALGFGFENFDAVGKWRERDGRYEIDASGELPGARTFESPAELRKILKGDSREFTSCLTRKLLTYSLGRALTSRDSCLVDDIVKYVEQHDHRFSDLIVAVVSSDAFRYTRGQGED